MAAPVAVVRARAVVALLASSATPTTRGAFVEALATTLLGLAARGDARASGLASGPCASSSFVIASSTRHQTPTEALVPRHARGGIVEAVVASLLAARGDDWVPTPPRPRACALPSGLHAYSLVAAAQPDLGDGGGDCHGSGSRVAVPPRPRVSSTPPAYSFILAAGPHGGDGGGVIDDDSGSGAATPLHAYSFVVATRPHEGDGGGFMDAATRRPGSTPMCFQALTSTRPPYTPSMFGAATGPGPLGLGRTRLFGLSSSLPSGRRHASSGGWCWTPWDPNNPNLRTKAEVIDDIIKHINEMELSAEESLKLKSAFLKRFYAEDPMSMEMRLDLVLIKIDELPNQIVEAQSKRKKSEWGTVKFMGRKIDLSKVLAVVGLFFKP